ncbi:Uu.00g010350.m01.CDS01 [Anthostomella pinea]|uniref:Uu.00g010350.m01.CDS01 n=1 Tax=Anthostomella pinea TaxID=933095 RepID=A0AAI8VXJ6_9PEZI|nr:Uu.00g010350.m01.CDS01 [Anthostomella pinea]
MAPKIFITGVTGYSGGQLLHTMIARHPEYHITGLVRNQEKKQLVASKFPTVHLVLGDLDSHEVIVEQSKQSDVVIQAADADHLGVIKSIAHGISEGNKNGAYIQMSGAASIFDTSPGLGNPSPKIWDDVADLQEITTFDQTHFHASSDQLLFSEAKRLGIRTILFAPPYINGRSEGTTAWKVGLAGVPDLVAAIKKRGKGYTVGEGNNIITTIHVKDVAEVILLFTESGLGEDQSKVEWGEKGVYYAENGQTAWREMVAATAKRMADQGTIETAELDNLTAEEADKVYPVARFWGGNFRVQATRLRSLGWEPKYPSAVETSMAEMGPGQQKDPDGASAAMAKALGIEELLEGILLNLDMKTLLLSQRVSKGFRSTIAASTRLQQALFFAPIGDSHADDRRFPLRNNLITARIITVDKIGSSIFMFKPWSSEGEEGRLPKLLDPVCIHYDPGYDPSGELEAQSDPPVGSWQKMLLTQPPGALPIQAEAEDPNNQVPLVEMVGEKEHLELRTLGNVVGKRRTESASTLMD